jgi:hypothetical protein
MKTSESISELAKALSAAQAEMTGAKKSANNPFFKSQYADLASVMQAIAKPFASHGLSFVQSVGHEAGGVCVTTLLMHESGQWIESDPLVLPPTKPDAQGYGSAITYAKRYGLQAMAGVPSVDDDGNAAVEGAVKPLRGKDKEMAQKYLGSFLEALEAEDGLALKQLGDELRENESMLSHVWGQFTHAQKTRIKELVFGVAS